MTGKKVMSENTKEHHEYVFIARMNIAYHERAERRYSLWLNYTAMMSLLLASASFIAVSQLSFLKGHGPLIVTITSLLVTVMNAAVLAFGMQNRAKRHWDLKRKWTIFHGMVVQSDKEDTAALKVLAAELVDINSSEPPPNESMLNKAYKSTCTAMGLKHPELKNG